MTHASSGPPEDHNRHLDPKDDFGIEAVAAALSAHYGHRVRSSTIRPIANPDIKRHVSDAKLRFHAPLPDGGNGFLLISGATDPRGLVLALDNIAAARRATSDRVSDAILPAALQGEIGGRVFAVWPAQIPFEAGNRLRARYRHQRYAGPVLDWSTALAVETLTPAATADVSADLTALAENAMLPDRVRKGAASALARVESGDWTPMACFQHGDFWVGNLLLPVGGRTPPFYVIDWGGMSRNGYPFLDMSRMLISLRLSHRYCAARIAAFDREIGCGHANIAGHILGALGRLGRNLEGFPPERFRIQTERLYDFITRF